MSNNTSIYNHANVMEISITNNKGNKIDISGSLLQLDIYEDIFVNHITATLSFRDTTDFLNEFPINGGEAVNIVFSDNFNIEVDNTIQKTLYINSVNSSMENSDGTKTDRIITLGLVSELAFYSKMKRFSFHFNNMSTAECISYMFQQINFDTDSLEIYDNEIKDYISNFWNFTQNIDYLTYTDIDAFFFETLKNYKYGKLSTLMSNRISEVWQIAKSAEQYAWSRNSVENYIFSSRFNLLDMYQIGGMGKTVYITPVTDYNFNVVKAIPNIIDNTKLGDINFFNDEFQSVDNIINATLRNESSELQRNLLLQQMNLYNVNVLLNGSLGRNVGDIIQFEIPSVISSPSNSISKRWNGNWIILQIRHTIDSTRMYKQRIKIWKNAFQGE